MDSKKDELKRRNENPVDDGFQVKRKKGNEPEVDVDDKPLCKYGDKCYQKNLPHLRRFRHPHRENNEDAPKNSDHSTESPSVPDPSHSSVQEKIEDDNKNKTQDSPCNTEKEESITPQLPPKDVKEWIKQKFLTDMPGDFYELWEFCKSASPENPLGTFKGPLGLDLVGPFELLNQSLESLTNTGKVSDFKDWRFYFDPPEFQSVLVDDLSKGFHIGYFRDSPSEMPAIVVSNTETESSVFTILGGNLFSALNQVISSSMKKTDPFKQSQLVKVKKQLEEWANNRGIPIENKEDLLKKRKKNMVAKTFYECGIVVPVNKKTKVGYRKIPETDANIKKICMKIRDSSNIEEQNKNSDALQELVTYVQYANDESDYGMGLELGLDLLAFGGDVFHPTILHLLGVAYELLERQEFAVILKAHLDDRRKLSKNVSP
uniref:EOG090X0BAY n=1 Tax=Scapholeberis mucronata TaxID=202097 RepID=A0A4Y7NKU0_9CRUS|nr:EOG090X0BAY [Scapholeberis mucronata]SVE93812.1 EOG090X0BAY [Scapholeberis mucronata]